MRRIDGGSTSGKTWKESNVELNEVEELKTRLDVLTVQFEELTVAGKPSLGPDPTPPRVELIVFTNTGQTYFFDNVENFRHTTTGFSFAYVGKATGLRRHAVFNNTSTSGYALKED